MIANIIDRQKGLKMKIRVKHYISVIILLALLTSCGSLSAPPVELPAPVTGRIEISDPDADGNVTITGSAGAVPGGSMVMAVNESVAGTVAMSILDLLVKPAYAETVFPTICSSTGYACAVADSDGAFVIILAADSNDSIVIGIIDSSTGEFISEVIRLVVGEDNPEANCADLGVAGEAVDIVIVPGVGTPIVLRKGTETTTNTLAIGTSPVVDVPIAGCYAYSIAVTINSANEIVLAATSKEDGKLWTGKLSGTTVSDKKSFVLSDSPMHIRFVGSSTEPVVALQDSESVSIAKVSLENGSIAQEIDITAEIIENGTVGPSEKVTGLVNSSGMHIIQMDDAAGHYLGALLTNKGEATDSYITLFAADTLDVLNTWPTPGLSMPVYAPTDVKLYLGSYYVDLIILDALDRAFVVSRPIYLAEQVELSRYEDITASGIIGWDLYPVLKVVAMESGGSSIPVIKFTITRYKEPEPPPSEPTQLVAASTDGKLFVLSMDNIEGGGLTYLLEYGNPLVAIDSDSSSQVIYAADGTTQEAVSGSYVVW